MSDRERPRRNHPAPTTQAETLPPEATEAVWTGFTGTLEGYTYYHESERDKNWEEDILTVAQAYLENHPWLVDDTTATWEAESYVSTPNMEWKSQYIPEKREEFLSAVNDLIPRIPEYEDGVLIWELQRVLAVIGECHAQISPYISQIFPLSFYPFQENGDLFIRVAAAPRNKGDLLYAQLTAINGIPIDQVLEMLRPYSPFDSPTGFLNAATVHEPSYLAQPYLLKAAGVMATDDLEAAFTFVTEAGDTVTETLPVMAYKDFMNLTLEDHCLYFQLPYSFYNWTGSSYWIDHWQEESILYIRLSQFSSNQEEAFKETNKEIYAVLNSVDSMDKVILDLRQNPGGSPPSAFAGLLNFLRNPKVEQVYVLIDSGCFSMSVIASYDIRMVIPGAIFVGTPTGQGLPTGSISEQIKTPHNWIDTNIPGGMSVLESGDSFLYFEPDVLVYQTLEDYKDGIDTVLQYVLDLN